MGVILTENAAKEVKRIVEQQSMEEGTPPSGRRHGWRLQWL